MVEASNSNPPYGSFSSTIRVSKDILIAARDLEKLPSELVQQVLEDLPMFKLLQLPSC